MIVFVDHADANEAQKLDPGGDLQLFRGQVGRLVLYERSPLNEPHLLELFYEPSP